MTPRIAIESFALSIVIALSLWMFGHGIAPRLVKPTASLTASAPEPTKCLLLTMIDSQTGNILEQKNVLLPANEKAWTTAMDIPDQGFLIVTYFDKDSQIIARLNQVKQFGNDAKFTNVASWQQTKGIGFAMMIGRYMVVVHTERRS